MPSYSHATLIGHLGADAEVKQNLTRLRLAVSVGYGDKKQTIWMQVTAFGKTAEFAARLHKGDAVLCAGRLDLNVWTDKQGVERRDITMVADTVQALGPKQAHSDDVPF